MYNFDYYAVLGIEYPSNQEEIKAAYRNLSKKYHPDLGGDIQIMKLINQAYDVLGNPEEKLKYDAWLISTVSANQNQEQEDKQEKKEYVMNLITIEGSIVQSYIDVSKLKINYRKYLDENNYLYFYEERNGSRISTIITYKNTWYEMLYRIHPERNPNSSLRNKYNLKPNIKKIVLVAIGVVVVFILCYLSIKDSAVHTPIAAPNLINTSQPTTAPTPTPIPPEPLPENGYIFKYPEAEMIAPLTINTEKTSENHYIYLKYQGEDRYMDMSFFVQAGSNIKVQVPLGTYEIYYCVGMDWYGTDLKFGQNTSYYTTDELFDFTYDGDYAYGHTITLYPVQNGNLKTTVINPEDFPE